MSTRNKPDVTMVGITCTPFLMEYYKRSVRAPVFRVIRSCSCFNSIQYGRTGYQSISSLYVDGYRFFYWLTVQENQVSRGLVISIYKMEKRVSSNRV
ncbi:MAG: hypothetical protein ACFFD4_12380 [Candidatus Odinarchaeota archaeon]